MRSAFLLALCAACCVPLVCANAPLQWSEIGHSGLAFLQRARDARREGASGEAEGFASNDASGDDGDGDETIGDEEDEDAENAEEDDQDADEEGGDDAEDADVASGWARSRGRGRHHCWTDNSGDFVDDGTEAGDARDADTRAERNETSRVMLGFARRLRQLEPKAPELKAATAGWGWVVNFLGFNMHYFKMYMSEFAEVLAEMLHMPVSGHPDYAGLQEVNRDMLIWLMTEYMPPRLSEVAKPGESDAQLIISGMITVARRMRLDDSPYLAYAKKVDRKRPFPVARTKRKMLRAINSKDYTELSKLVTMWAEGNIPNQREWYSNPPPEGLGDWFLREIAKNWAEMHRTLPRSLDNKEQLDFTMTHLPLMTRCYFGCNDRWNEYKAVHDSVDYIRDQVKSSRAVESLGTDSTDIAGEFVQSLKLFGRPVEEWGPLQKKLMQTQMPDGSWNQDPKASTDCYYIIHTTYPVVMGLMQPVLKRPPGYVPRPSLFPLA